MTDRFEIEVDTTKANEKWHVEVEENLRRQAEARGGTAGLMTAEQRPDVDEIARSMLLLHGATRRRPPPRAMTTTMPTRGPRHPTSPTTPRARPRCTRPPAVTASAI